MPETEKRAIVLGDACVDVMVPMMQITDPDVLSPSDRTLEPALSAGGTAANTAAALSKLGIKTSYMGTLGADYGGRFLLEDLKQRDIYSDLTLIDNESNTVYVFAFIDGNGERHPWAFPRTGVSYADYDLSKIDLESIRNASWLHASGMTILFDGTLRESMPEIFKIAYEAGVPTSFDLNTRVNHLSKLESGIVDSIRKTIPYTKYLLGSGPDEFLSFHPCDNWRDSVRAFAKNGHVAVGRMGKDGAFLVDGDREEQKRPIDVPVVNTIGAGDAFNAGFIAAILKGKSTSEAVSWGNGVASYKVSGNSARHTPKEAELATFIG